MRPICKKRCTVPSDQLADHKPKTLAQLEQALQASGVNFPQLVQAVMVLAGAGVVLAAQEDTAATKARKHTERLNTHLMQKVRSSNDLNYLASPLTGGGVTVPRFQQLFLLAKQQGHKQPQDWARLVWNILAAQSQRLLKDGKTLESAEENLAELTRQASEFAEKRLPILKALQIA